MKISKTKAKSASVTLLVALFGGLGLSKALDWTASQGDVVEKVSAILTTIGGAAAQFSKSDIVKALGIIGMYKGGESTIQAFITDSAGNVKPDKVSQTVAKAIMPGPGVAGLRGLGNVMMLPDPSGYQTLTGLGNLQEASAQYTIPTLT